jgi:AcrR family transcriptional regulator
MLDLNRPFKDRNGRFVFKWTTCSNDVRRMTMSGTKDNRRVQYTMDRFKDALLHILATKPLDEVTVTELCRQADLNRGTFYLHFQSPRDLFERIEMDLVEAIRPYLTVKINDMATWLVPILNVIANQPQAAAIILNNPDSVVLKKITDPIRQKTETSYQSWYGETDKSVLTYYYAFFIDGAIGVLTKWLKNGTVERSEQIAAVIENVVTKGAPH